MKPQTSDHYERLNAVSQDPSRLSISPSRASERACIMTGGWVTELPSAGHHQERLLNDLMTSGRILDSFLKESSYHRGQWTRQRVNTVGQKVRKNTRANLLKKVHLISSELPKQFTSKSCLSQFLPVKKFDFEFKPEDSWSLTVWFSNWCKAPFG